MNEKITVQLCEWMPVSEYKMGVVDMRERERGGGGIIKVREGIKVRKAKEGNGR